MKPNCSKTHAIRLALPIRRAKRMGMIAVTVVSTGALGSTSATRHAAASLRWVRGAPLWRCRQRVRHRSRHWSHTSPYSASLNLNTKAPGLVQFGGRYWARTSDHLRVKQALVRTELTGHPLPEQALRHQKAQDDRPDGDHAVIAKMARRGNQVRDLTSSRMLHPLSTTYSGRLAGPPVISGGPRAGAAPSGCRRRWRVRYAVEGHLACREGHALGL